MKHRTPPTPLSPDSLAFALLRAAEVVASVIDGRNLDTALSACRQAWPLEPAQRGAVQDLAYGALRQFGRGDFLLKRLLREPLGETDEKRLLRALLLAALYRLETRPAAAHTTVNQAVSAAGAIGHGQFRALTNAVLRTRLREEDRLLKEADADPQARRQHPQWWIEKLRSAYPSSWQDILAAGNARPPMTLRVNLRRGTAAAYLARLGEAGIAARCLDDCAILLDAPLMVDKLPGFSEGLVSVQDWGAQHAARLLDVRNGQRVLDACAAPGGKTAHLLESADIDLLALDLDPRRTARIEENLRRLGLTAKVVTADCRDTATWWDGRPFDRILADVPCSASGVVRRHPDIKWLRRPEDIGRFARSQREILAALWQTLAPGGRMLMCTCSLFPEENDAQIAAFLRDRADAECLPLDARSGTSLQLIPQSEHDGFFYALLQKRA